MSGKDKLNRSTLLKRLLSGVLIFLIVCAVAELGSRWVSTTSTATFGDNIRVDQKMLVSDFSSAQTVPLNIQTGFNPKSPSNDFAGKRIVAIGDSVIARGFYPELFYSLMSNQLLKPYSVYNLGVEGASFSLQKATFDRLVRKHLKPHVVILNISIHAVNVYGTTPRTDYAEPSWTPDNSQDYYERCVVLDNRDFISKSYCDLSRHFYFLRLVKYYHAELDKSLKILFQTRYSRYKNLIIKYPSVSKVGFSPNFVVLSKDVAGSEALKKIMIGVYKDDFKHFTLGTWRLDQLIDDLNAHSVKVILVLMPAYQPVMRTVYDHYSLPPNKTIEKTLEAYSQKKGIAFVNLFESLQDPENFQDPVHMNVIGATQTTKLLVHTLFSGQYTHPKGYLNLIVDESIRKAAEKKS